MSMALAAWIRATGERFVPSAWDCRPYGTTVAQRGSRDCAGWRVKPPELRAGKPRSNGPSPTGREKCQRSAQYICARPVASRDRKHVSARSSDERLHDFPRTHGAFLAQAEVRAKNVLQSRCGTGNGADSSPFLLTLLPPPQPHPPPHSSSSTSTSTSSFFFSSSLLLLLLHTPVAWTFGGYLADLDGRS